eukprot:1035762_1
MIDQSKTCKKHCMTPFIKAQPLVICALIALVGGDRCYSNASIPFDVHSHQTAYDITSRVLYLFGGVLPPYVHTQSIYKWDISTDTWTELPISTPTSTFKGSPVTRFYSPVNAAATIHDVVYFIGINDGFYDSETVYRFDLASLQWLDPASINRPPHPSVRGCLTHNTTHIFMVGGRTNNTSYTDQLQMYSISGNTWT